LDTDNCGGKEAYTNMAAVLNMDWGAMSSALAKGIQAYISMLCMLISHTMTAYNKSLAICFMFIFNNYALFLYWLIWLLKGSGHKFGIEVLLWLFAMLCWLLFVLLNVVRFLVCFAECNR
jgi:hypothetical protein